LYYFARKSAEFNENEVRYCCRIPVNGGAEEILTEYEYSLNPLNICFVADEMIIFINGKTILGYDIKKDKMITLWNSEANGYVWVGSLQYYNGNIYFLAMANRGDPDEDNVPKDDRFLEEWGSAGNSYLYSLNIKTKKAEIKTPRRYTPRGFLRKTEILFRYIMNEIIVRSKAIPHKKSLSLRVSRRRIF
jgi:hypothetical protein